MTVDLSLIDHICIVCDIIKELIVLERYSTIVQVH